MSPDVYKTYRHRVKALKDARKRTKEARDNIRAAWRTNPQLGFTALNYADYLPEYASLTKQLLINVGTRMLVLMISLSMCTSVLKQICLMPTQRILKAGLIVLFLLQLLTAYVGPSLTSRAPIAWGENTQAAEAAASQATQESQYLLAQALQQRRQTNNQMDIDNLVN